MKSFKKILLVLLVIVGKTLIAQSRNKATMLPIMEKGYYVNFKNDTVKGEVQVNPEDPTDFYKQFAFKLPQVKKTKLFNTQKVKAYGFGGRDFVAIEMNGEKIFTERLVTGRLRFYEYKFNGKVDGVAAIESAYFVRDTGADDPDLKEAKKLPSTFYKRALKPYLKDQAMLWVDLDKYNFDKNNLIKTFREFNRFYASTGN